jgi:hypothetical protein
MEQLAASVLVAVLASSLTAALILTGLMIAIGKDRRDAENREREQKEHNNSH